MRTGWVGSPVRAVRAGRLAVLAGSLAAVLGVALGASATSLLSQDRSAVAPTQVLLENEYVRVQYHDVKVGETVPFHSHPGCVVYALKPYKAKIRLADGTERMREGKTGDIFWNEPTNHSVQNLGEADIHNLVVEIKAATAPASPR